MGGGGGRAYLKSRYQIISVAMIGHATCKYRMHKGFRGSGGMFHRDKKK